MSALAAIHVGKKALGLDDDDYRAMLVRVTGKRSAKDMTEGERLSVVSEMRRQGMPAKEGGKKPGLRGPFAPKLTALWLSAWNLGIVRSRHDKALVAFIERQTGIAHTSWLRDPKDAAKAIDGLKLWIAREAGVEWPSSPTASAREIKLAVIRAQLALLHTPELSAGITIQRLRHNSRSDDQALDHAIATNGALIRERQLS